MIQISAKNYPSRYFEQLSRILHHGLANVTLCDCALSNTCHGCPYYQACRDVTLAINFCENKLYLSEKNP